MVVPSTKRKSHGAPHQRLTLDETKRSRVPLDSVVGLLRPKFGTRLWNARTCPRLESGDMSPHSKASEASAAKPPRPGCVTRHNFMFFCLSCPLVRCSLPTRWIQNFCVGWLNCFRGREATQNCRDNEREELFLARVVKDARSDFALVEIGPALRHVIFVI